MKEIVTSLNNIVKLIKNLPAAPVFDRAARKIKIAEAFEGLPEKFLEAALNEAENKHNEIHGDSTDKIARLIIQELAPNFGGIENLFSIVKEVKNQDIENNKVKFTTKELGDENNEGAQKFLSKVRALYSDGKQVSEIATDLNFYSYQTLNNFVRENKDSFARKS